MSDELKPRNKEWIAPSILHGCHVGICDDAAGKRFFCELRDEGKGWEPLREATPLDIQIFLNVMAVRDEMFGPEQAAQ